MGVVGGASRCPRDGASSSFFPSEVARVKRPDATDERAITAHGSRLVGDTNRVSSALGHRLVVLAAVAVVAAVAALAVIEQRTPAAGTTGLTSAPAPAGWNTAFAGSRGAVGDAQRTTCGQVLTPESLGVTHPVLPCGAKVVLRNGGTSVLSEVIDHELVEPGRQLEVTEGLAALLELDGTEEIEWRFAAAADR